MIKVNINEVLIFNFEIGKLFIKKLSLLKNMKLCFGKDFIFLL
jgi:hypothetical protein